MPARPRLSNLDRALSAGLVVGPAAFITAWAVSGAMTPGYSPIRDPISDLGAVEASTRGLMNMGFAAFAVSVGASAIPARRFLGTSAAVVLGANMLLTVGIALVPLGQSPEGDRAHSMVAGLGYLALAAMGPSAAPTLAKRKPLLGRISVAVGAVSIACLGLSVVRPEAGFWQRAGLLTTDAWLIAMGLRALTGAARDEG